MLVFDSDDLGRTEEFLCESYAPMRIGSTSLRSPTHISRAASGSLSVDYLDLGFVMSYDVAPLGKICLCDIQSGAVEDQAVAGTHVTESFGPGEVFSLSPPDRPYTGRINRARYSITMFDPALFNEVLPPAPDEEPVRLLDHRPITLAAGQALRQTIDHVGRHVLTDPALSDNPLLFGTAARYLASRVLATFPHTGLTEPTAVDRRDAQPAAVRRAIAFIDTMVTRDITLTDIAAAAYVTPRALQYAFQRHLGTTPMAYLRRLRLNSAHHELQATHPGTGNTVTTIAAHWGFTHPGRFATTYHHAYGQTPRHTLHH